MKTTEILLSPIPTEEAIILSVACVHQMYASLLSLGFLAVER